jgi:hypothetical protein
MNNIMSMYQRFMQNPSQALMEARFNVPQGMTNPNDILQHLMNTGQVSQQRINQVMQMRNNPMIQQLMGMK